MNSTEEPIDLPRLRPSRLAVVEGEKLLAQEQLSKELSKYWADPTSLAERGIPRPVDLVPCVRVYAEAVFTEYGRQYINDFASVDEFENFLVRTLSPAVIQQILPPAPLSDRPEIGFYTSLEEFKAVFTAGIDGYRPGVVAPDGVWERVLEQTWFDRWRGDAQWSGFAGWTAHPFVWAMRSRRNREFLSEELEAALRLRTLRLKADWWNVRAQDQTPEGERKGPLDQNSIPARSKDKLSSGICEWSEIQVVFTSDQRVQIIKSGVPSETLTYKEMGFEDGRTKNPKKAWDFLLDLAKSDGFISRPPRGAPWSAIEKRVQEVRRVFCKRFQLPSDPIPYSNGGYQALFKIKLAPSFNA